MKVTFLLVIACTPKRVVGGGEDYCFWNLAQDSGSSNTWPDGSPITGQNGVRDSFDFDEPLDPSEAGVYYYDNGYLHAKSKTLSTAHALCQTDPPCPNLFIPVAGFCFLFDPTNKDYDTSVTYCAGFGTTLAHNIGATEIAALLPIFQSMQSGDWVPPVAAVPVAIATTAVPPSAPRNPRDAVRPPYCYPVGTRVRVCSYYFK